MNTHWPYSEYNLYDKYYFIGKNKDYEKCSQAWKDSFPPEVRSCNGYKERVVDYIKW